MPCFRFFRSALSADPNRGEIKKMQNRRKPPRRRTSVRQRRFSAVEKTKTLFRLLKESARIPTSFRKSDYTKAVIKKLVFAFSVCAFSLPESRRDKKDAEALKRASSPYMRTAETRFGGRKSENIISSFEGIREDSDSIPQIRLY